MEPSEIPELARYRSVRRFVRKHLDMQFADVRTMLRLPLPELGLHGGCNFAAAATLCDLLSGISVVLFDPPPRYYQTKQQQEAKQKGRDRGIRFKALLDGYFLWEQGQRKAACISVLYDRVRNPLAHELALDRKGSRTKVAILKKPLSEEQIVEMESSTARPSWLPQPIERRGRRWRLSVPGLYWGTFQVLKRLTLDRFQMDAAGKHLSRRRVY